VLARKVGMIRRYRAANYSDRGRSSAAWCLHRRGKIEEVRLGHGRPNRLRLRSPWLPGLRQRSVRSTRSSAIIAATLVVMLSSGSACEGPGRFVRLSEHGAFTRKLA